MSKFTQGETDTMIEAMVSFMRELELHYHFLDDLDGIREKQDHVLKILASKPEYAYFYLSQDEREEYGGQQ